MTTPIIPDPPVKEPMVELTQVGRWEWRCVIQDGWFETGAWYKFGAKRAEKYARRRLARYVASKRVTAARLAATKVITAGDAK